MVELTKILHSELLLQRRDDTLKQLLTGGCGGHEDDGIGGGRHRKLVDSVGEDEDGVEEL